MVELDTIYVLIGIVGAVFSMIVGAWRLNDAQEGKIKAYVNEKIENPETGLRRCIDKRANELEGKVADVKSNLAEKIGEVKGEVTELKNNHANLLQAFNNHLREAEGFTKLGTAKIKEFDETKKDLETIKLSVINLQHWQTDELKRQSGNTE